MVAVANPGILSEKFPECEPTGTPSFNPMSLSYGLTLSEPFPEHVVDAGIGHSQAVARKHGFQATDDRSAQAIGGALSGSSDGAKTRQNPIRQFAETD